MLCKMPCLVELPVSSPKELPEIDSSFDAFCVEMSLVESHVTVNVMFVKNVMNPQSQVGFRGCNGTGY